MIYFTLFALPLPASVLKYFLTLHLKCYFDLYSILLHIDTPKICFIVISFFNFLSKNLCLFEL